MLDTTKLYAIAADSAGYVYAAADSIMYRTAAPVTSVAAPAGHAAIEPLLLPNFPNPFSAETDIPFILPQACRAALKIYTALGQLAATPVAARLGAGRHTIAWRPGVLPPGVYLCRLQTPYFTAVRTVVIEK